MVEWKCRECGSTDATNAWHDWCGTCAEDPARIIEALHADREELRAKVAELAVTKARIEAAESFFRECRSHNEAVFKERARAESAEARVAEIEKEKPPLMSVERALRQEAEFQRKRFEERRARVAELDADRVEMARAAVNFEVALKTTKAQLERVREWGENYLCEVCPYGRAKFNAILADETTPEPPESVE